MLTGDVEDQSYAAEGAVCKKSKRGNRLRRKIDRHKGPSSHNRVGEMMLELQKVTCVPQGSCSEKSVRCMAHPRPEHRLSALGLSTHLGRLRFGDGLLMKAKSELQRSVCNGLTSAE